MLLLQNVEGSTLIQRLLSSPAHYSHNIANQLLNLLTEILNRRYPKVEDITESKLLEWKMWPSFLGMIGISRLTTVSCKAKKKQAVCDEQASYLRVAPL